MPVRRILLERWRGVPHHSQLKPTGFSLIGDFERNYEEDVERRTAFSAWFFYWIKSRNCNESCRNMAHTLKTLNVMAQTLHTPNAIASAEWGFAVNGVHLSYSHSMSLASHAGLTRVTIDCSRHATECRVNAARSVSPPAQVARTQWSHDSYCVFIYIMCSLRRLQVITYQRW